MAAAANTVTRAASLSAVVAFPVAVAPTQHIMPAVGVALVDLARMGRTKHVVREALEDLLTLLQASWGFMVEAAVVVHTTRHARQQLWVVQVEAAKAGHLAAKTLVAMVWMGLVVV